MPKSDKKVTKRRKWPKNAKKVFKQSTKKDPKSERKKRRKKCQEVPKSAKKEEFHCIGATIRTH